MKKSFVLFIMTLMTKVLSGQFCDGQPVILSENGQCDNNPWVKVFEDNFDGNSLDLSKWTLPYQGVERDFNFSKSKQWLANTGTTPFIPIENNIQISNGTLKLIAKRENVIGTYVTDWSTTPPTSQTESFQFTSGEIVSKYKFGYGKFEIRCKIPKGKGFWPAFWTYSENHNHINNEIDVFEFWNDNTKNHNMTVHYDGQMCLTDYNGPDFSQNFHTFTVIWDNYKIEWYVDGNLKRRSTKFYSILGQQVDCNGLNAFHQYIMEVVFPRDPMQIIAGLGIQNGLFLPDLNTPFPSVLEIDYIRYFQKRDCVNIVNITNTSQLGLSNDYFNLILGSNILVNGNVEIHSGEQLALVAKNEIKLSTDFSVKKGTDFSGRIDNTICSENMIMPHQPSVTEHKNQYYHESNEQLNNQEFTYKKDLEVKIYPNPTNGILNIEFEQKSFENYQLNITDSQGRIIYTLESVKSNKIQFDLNNFNRGLYAITIIDKVNKQAIIKKVIYR